MKSSHNSLGSILTYGVPTAAALLGLLWLLQRRRRKDGKDNSNDDAFDRKSEKCVEDQIPPCTSGYIDDEEDVPKESESRTPAKERDVLFSTEKSTVYGDGNGRVKTLTVNQRKSGKKVGIGSGDDGTASGGGDFSGLSQHKAEVQLSSTGGRQTAGDSGWRGFTEGSAQPGVTPSTDVPSKDEGTKAELELQNLARRIASEEKLKDDDAAIVQAKVSSHLQFTLSDVESQDSEQARLSSQSPRSLGDVSPRQGSEKEVLPPPLVSILSSVSSPKSLQTAVPALSSTISQETGSLQGKVETEVRSSVMQATNNSTVQLPDMSADVHNCSPALAERSVQEHRAVSTQGTGSRVNSDSLVKQEPAKSSVNADSLVSSSNHSSVSCKSSEASHVLAPDNTLSTKTIEKSTSPNKSDSESRNKTQNASNQSSTKRGTNTTRDEVKSGLNKSAVTKENAKTSGTKKASPDADKATSAAPDNAQDSTDTSSVSSHKDKLHTTSEAPGSQSMGASRGKAPEPVSGSGEQKQGSPGKEERAEEVKSERQTTAMEPMENGRLPESGSPVCDTNSEASNDSGRGGSVGETLVPLSAGEVIRFDFNFPSDLCGRLIGRGGKNIHHIKEVSGATVTLSSNPFTPDFQVCRVQGLQSEVDRALMMIRKKFPQAQYPGLDMAALAPNPPPAPVVLPEIMQLNLAEGVSMDIVVSAIVNAGHIFVQQPTHPTFPSLERLNQFMNSCYNDNTVPMLPRPVEGGIICAAESEGQWYRAQVVQVYPQQDECDIKYVDYGGYTRVPINTLKQIRSDFMTLPFQAVECYLANITPLQDEEYFSDVSNEVLLELTSGKMLQGQVIGRGDDSICYVHLYQVSGHSVLLINRELVNREVVRWIEVL